MTDLKQRIVKNYSYDKKAEDDIYYHLNFGKKNTKTKKSKDEVIIEMIISLKDEMHNEFGTIHNELKVINKRLEQLENQAIAHGWNIKKI